MKLLARIATRLGIDASAYHLNPKEAASNFKSAIDFGLSHGDPGLWLPVAASYLHATALDNPLNKTREEAESLLEVGRRHNDLKSQLITYMALGLAYNHYGHYADAFVCGQQALAIALQTNDRRRAFISGLVMIEHAKRNPGLRSHARELILFLRRNSLLDHNLSYQGYYYTHVAAFFHEKKALDVAIRYYKRALEIFDEVTKEPHSQAKTLLGIGLALTQNGHYDRAAEHLELALSLYEELEQPLYIGWVRYCIGWNDHKSGKSHKAQAYLEETYQYLEDLPPSAGRNSLLKQLRQDLDEIRSHLKGTL
jgi:tetratricopeptide (TPR) repeat protein